MRASLARPRFPQARLCRQARWDLASDGRWRASVRSFCGFCVTPVSSASTSSRQLGVEIFRLEQWREKAIGGIDASLKQRKGDPVQAELDSAMKRIGELTMQVELLEPRRRPSAGRRRSMSAATSPGTGLAYGLRRVCAAWGMARSSFYARPPASTPSSRRQSVGDRSPRSRTRRCWWRSKPTWRHRPGQGYRKVWAGFGSVATSGLPASGCSA